MTDLPKFYDPMLDSCVGHALAPVPSAEFKPPILHLGERYIDSTVVLDGDRWDDCLFIRCTLVAGTDYFTMMTRCTFESCTHLGLGWPEGFVKPDERIASLEAGIARLCSVVSPGTISWNGVDVGEELAALLAGKPTT